jgi:hypothetical protein
MDGKQLRQTFAYGFLALYSLYGIFGIGMTGLLFSFAIGLIVTSLGQPIELNVAATILSGLVYKIIAERRRKEGFESEPRALKGAKDAPPLGEGQSATAISKRVEQMGVKGAFQPSGVLSSSFAESFADINSSEQPSNAGSATAKPAGEKTPAPSASTPAATNEPTVSTQMASALPSSNAAAAATPDPKATEKPAAQQSPEAATPATPQTSGFSDKGTAGMFKLGSIPADAVGGAHIDVGTTLMNALNSLKPDQVKAMTEDTRKLMETQKSLMGMLTTRKPMITDGKQMMETFTEMFGKQ